MACRTTSIRIRVCGEHFPGCSGTTAATSACFRWKARQFRLAGRGEIRVGADADIVVFDAATISDTATFERPKAQAAGIDCVLVNGKVAYRNGDTEPRRNGRFLPREPTSAANCGP